MRALVIGGTGPTGPHVISGLLQRGFEVTLFHRGVHEPPDLPDVLHVHGDPHFAETIREATGQLEADVVVCMYGRVALLAEAFAGRCGQFIGIGGVPAYRNCLEPGRLHPWGMALLARESGPLADADGEPPRFARLVLAAERAVLERAADNAFRGAVIRYPAIHGPRNQVAHEWMVMKRLRDRRPFMILPDSGLGIMGRCAAPNAAEMILACVDRPEVANGQAYNCADDDQFCWRQWVEVVAELAGGELPIVSLPGELAEATYRALIPMADFAPHTLVDIAKARAELGYRQVISARDQIAETVEWLAVTPPQPGPGLPFPDPFDYEREDRLVEAYRRAVRRVTDEAGWEPAEVYHPLPHPKQPGTGYDERGR